MITAHRVEKNRRTNSTSLESLWDLAAAVVLSLGIVIAIGILLIPLLSGSLLGILLAPLQVVATLFGYLFCRSIGEHIRLQKKIAGLAYQGQISGPATEIVVVCSNCGHLLHSQERCDNCGALIKSNGTVDGEQ